MSLGVQRASRTLSSRMSSDVQLLAKRYGSSHQTLSSDVSTLITVYIHIYTNIGIVVSSDLCIIEQVGELLDDQMGGHQAANKCLKIVDKYGSGIREIEGLMSCLICWTTGDVITSYFRRLIHWASRELAER